MKSSAPWRLVTVRDVCHRFDADRLGAMAQVNAAMKHLTERTDFDDHLADFFAANVAFHDHFLDLTHNRHRSFAYCDGFGHQFRGS